MLVLQNRDAWNEADKLRRVMKLSAFDYDLPPELIAQRALPERDASRMLLLDRATGAWQDRQFRELPDLLRGDEVIVVNAARVIPASLLGRRAGTRAQPPAKKPRVQREFLSSPVEVLLARQLLPDICEGLVHPDGELRAGERLLSGPCEA